jgi:GPH family glycoside/pentoside/hexuronide:cation symporter
VAFAGAPAEDPRLTPLRKSVYATGDVTVNTVLVALNIVYVFHFLTDVAGLRPELAGLVQLIGRTVDAFTDPLMGRISDGCRWRSGRRRPFFLLGAIPFGACFALLWLVPDGTQLELFAYYTVVYVLLSVSMTVLAVPYLALQPELARGYDARTSLNTYRNVGSLVGVLAGAVLVRPVADAFGGGAAGYAATGWLYGALVALPWFAVHAVTWERPDYQARSVHISFRQALGMLTAHRSFRRLVGLYVCGRIAMDVVGAMLIVYFTHVIGRTGDFELAMGIFFVCVALSLPVWLRIAPRYEKSTLFVVGSAWWALSFGLLLFAQPDWPRGLLLLFAPLGAIGYALVDLMPWSMLGEVVDEDDLASGERREGLYNGFFMFVRKVAGTIAVALLGLLLGGFGLRPGETPDADTLLVIRLLASVAPAALLVAGIWIARGYPLTRVAHDRILAQLDARDAG